MSVNPPGFPKLDPVDPQDITECWIDKTDYPNLVKYAADPEKSTFVDDYIVEACAIVNKMCNRKFNLQQYDQILPNQLLTVRDYVTFVLNNRPIVTIDKVWLQVVDTFALLDSTYFQLMTLEGIVKILPQFNVYVQTTLPTYMLKSTSNLWIRFTSGYEAGDVPRSVKRATALVVDSLFGMDSITPNVSSFRTQTYSETQADASNDPIMTRVKDLLKPFKITTFI